MGAVCTSIRGRPFASGSPDAALRFARIVSASAISISSPKGSASRAAWRPDSSVLWTTSRSPASWPKSATFSRSRRELVQDPRVPQRRGHSRPLHSASLGPDGRSAPRDSRHRQGPLGEDRRADRDRRDRISPGAPAGVSGDASRPAAPARRRSQDRGPSLPPVEHQESRRARAGDPRRPPARPEGNGPQEGSADPSRDQRARPARRAAAARRGQRGRRRPSSLRSASHAPEADHRRRQPAPGLRNVGRHRYPGRRRAAVGDGGIHRLSLVERVLAHGETKSSVLLCGGCRPTCASCRASLGAALQYFTGSKAHNIALRDRALQRGLKLNDTASSGSTTASPSPARTRTDIYRALGLAPIPPELRENRGEIQAAERDDAAALVDRASTSAGDLAHAHDRQRRPRRPRDDGAGRGAAGPQLHRHHRSQPVAGDGQRPRRARVRWSTPRGFARSTIASMASRCSRDRMRHPSGWRMDLADDCLAASTS